VLTPEAATGADGVRSWFDSGPRGADPATLQRSADLVAGVVAAAAAGGGPVVVAGFSQGAALALALGEVRGLDSVVALCPFLAEVDGLEPGEGPPALLLPAAQDDVVPAFLGEDAAAAVAAAGREVTCEVLAGGHAVSDVALERGRAWLVQRHPGRVRISVGLPVDRVSAGAELVSGDAIAELAATWEAVGFDAAHVTDHPAPDARWLAGGGHHALEPTVALAAAAMATTSLRLHTHVLVLGYRNPFLAAKAIASLDVVSGGRVILGVAAGYLRPEFAALGAEFERRGEVLDETLALLPRIWSEHDVAVAGEGWSARSVTALPRPAQRPHPPIWVGGNSERAMRRALTLAQGWSPFPTTGGIERATRTAAIADADTLAARLARFEEIRLEVGRADRPTVCFAPFGTSRYLRDPEGSLARLVEEVEGLGAMGVDWVCLQVPGLGRAEVVQRAGELGEALGLRPR
jgi:probable F420-dependent oxidoreductase